MANLNSREFLTQLVNDLLTGSQNVKNLKIYQESIPAARSVDMSDTEGSVDDVLCEFSFTYLYNGHQIPLQIIFSGTVYFDVKSINSNGDGYNTQAISGVAIGNKDYSGMEIAIRTKSGQELDTTWLNTNDKIADQLCNKLLGKYMSNIELDQ